MGTKWVPKRPLPPKFCLTHILQWWNLAQLCFTSRRSKKYIKSRDIRLSSGNIRLFSPEIGKFWYVKKYRYRLHFDTQFLVLVTFFESFKIVLINMVTILMMTSKMTSPYLLKIKTFCNKDYDIISFSMTSPLKFVIWSIDWNYIANVVMWPNFGNSIL